MTPEAQVELQGLNAGARVLLHILDLARIGVEQKFYLTPHTLNGAQIGYGGQTYTYFPVNLTGISKNADGSGSPPKFTVSNRNNFASGLCVSYQDLVGARVTRIKTLKQFLDGQPMANGNACISKDIFEIRRKSALNNNVAEFEVQPLSALEGKKIPKLVALRNSCSRSYRIWNGSEFVQGTCPYAGDAMFKRDGTSTDDPTLDACPKNYGGCNARFPTGAGLPPMPIWGFPGMRQLV